MGGSFMSHDFLAREQIEKLLGVENKGNRATTRGDVQLVRQNLDRLIMHDRKQSMEEAVKEYEFLKEYLDERTINVDHETEQQIFFSFQYPKYSTENYALQDTGFMIINKK